MPNDAKCIVCGHFRASHVGMQGCKECGCTRTWQRAHVSQGSPKALKSVSTQCANKGCLHDVTHHRLKDVKIMTSKYDDDGEPLLATMGYEVVCYDVCQDTQKPPHQCHCKRFQWRAPSPTPHQLRELP